MAERAVGIGDMTDEQARRLTLILFAGAAMMGALFALVALGVFGGEQRGILMIALAVGAVGDLALAGFIRWRRGQATQP